MAEPPRKTPRTDDVRQRKRLRDRERARTRVNIGKAFPEWRDLREKEGHKSDGELAAMLLNL